jgi:oxygen-dependent protoporphyrinogen oxidase
VTAIEREGGQYRIRAAGDAPRLADGVILATPAFAAAEVVASLDAPLATLLAGIPYASSAIVSLAYPRRAIRHSLDAHGYVVPRAERSPILACTWSSAKWANRAPEETALLRVFIGRYGQTEATAGSDDDLRRLAHDEVAARLGTTEPPHLTRVHRWPRGMPQYTLGHRQRLAAIERQLDALPGLALAGAAYRGVGLPDCITSGQTAAERIEASLQAHSRLA